MRPRIAIVALTAVALGVAALPIQASVTQRIWLANGQDHVLAASRYNVISMNTDGTDVRTSPTFVGVVSAVTGWSDSLYVGTSSGIIRTDLEGVAVETSLACASPYSMTVDPTAPALYAVCSAFNQTRIPIYRYPLGADGSMGTGNQVAMLASRGDGAITQGGFLYVLETYPDYAGVVRMPLNAPTTLAPAWYGALRSRAFTVSPASLFLAASGSSTDSALVTPLASPDWQTGISLPHVSTAPITQLAVRGQTLYSVAGELYNGTSTVNRQSLTTLASPTVVASWIDLVNHRQPQITGIYAGEQAQEWYVDSASRAVSAGAFTAPIRASSGLPATLASATPLVCSISGTTVTPLAAGTCTITGEQAGNAAYLAAATGSVSVELTVPKRPATTISLSKPRLVGDSIVTSATTSGPGSLRQTGSVSARGRKAKSTTICTTKATAKKAGPVTLTCRLNATGRKLRALQALTVTLTTTFTPTGGAKQTTTQKLKLARSASARR